MAKKVSRRFGKTNVRLIIKKKMINRYYDKMTIEEKRALCEMVFGGYQPDGRRMGVYIEWDKNKNWKFHIHGHLIDEEDLPPMDEEMKEAYFINNPFKPKQKELLTKSSLYYQRE